MENLQTKPGTTPEHIVILGGGFGGRYAAQGLAARLPIQHRITLVDRVGHMLYTPMLTEVAGGTVRPADIAVPASTLPRRVRFLQAEIASADPASKQVTLATGEVLQATQLVFALGAATAFHDVPGARENSTPYKTLADAEAVLGRLDEIVRQAALCTDPDERRSLLTIAVAGGGYTGVETIAAAGAHLREKAEAAGLSPDDVHLMLIEPTERLMHETAASLAAYSRQHLEQHGIRVLLHTGVNAIEGRPESQSESQPGRKLVKLTDGTSFGAGLVIWDAGIIPSPVLEHIALPKGKHHGILTNACFQVPGLPGVWAIGDCAEIPQPGTKPDSEAHTYAQTAQNATREGTHLAQNINALLRGRAPRPFRYTMIGQLALLSHRRAVAEILGIKLTGLLAWAMWWAIYILKLPYTPGRLGVLKSLLLGTGTPISPPPPSPHPQVAPS